MNPAPFTRKWRPAPVWFLACSLAAAAVPVAFAQAVSSHGPSANAANSYADASQGYSSSSAPVSSSYASSDPQAPTLGGNSQTPSDQQPNSPSGNQGPGYGRRTYGRAAYSDRWSNKDGSNKYSFEGGGGFSIPTGATKHYQNLGWNLKVGGGYNWNRRLGAMVDYDYNSFGVPSKILNQVNSQGGGATHLWSLTVNPRFNYKTSGRVGGYVLAGGGFYRKVVSFTQPFNSQCAYYSYYGCVPGTVNQTVAHFSNNAGGLDFGTGVTYKLSEFGNWKVFVEARYVWVDNQPSSASKSANGYAPTNYRTEFVPITFGFRW